MPSDGIHCEIFEAWLDKSEGDLMPYEALSYTWGNVASTVEITVTNCQMAVTINLFSALRHLRYENENRILWIDAICIDQTNLEERGYQVNQMGEIYKNAERVVVWLGEATDETDIAMDSIIKLHKEISKTASIQGASSQNWVNSRPFELCTFSGGFYDWKDAESLQRRGLASLLGRSWFRRIWVLQEIANARVALIACGRKFVSAGTFALVPSGLELNVDHHCQAVLDIMPGVSRKESWWSQRRDLRTLLMKFEEGEATDPRDKIFALLGMATDVCDSKMMYADYEKDLQEVIQQTTLFLISYAKAKWKPLPGFLSWTLSEFSGNLNSLATAVMEEALLKRRNGVIEHLLNNPGVDANSRAKKGETMLWLALESLDMGAITAFLQQDNAKVNLRNRQGETPLTWALKNRQDAIAELLLEHKESDLNSKNKEGQTLLSCAAELGNKRIVGLLSEKSVLDWDMKDHNDRTPLSFAAENGHPEVSRMILEQQVTSIYIQDSFYRTPVFWAVSKGHVAVARVLLEQNRFTLVQRDNLGKTPLLVAAENGQQMMVELLIDQYHCNAYAVDYANNSALSLAARRGHIEVVKILLKNGAKADSRNCDGWTPLHLISETGDIALLKLLLENGADVNATNTISGLGYTPLHLASNIGHVEAVQLLIDKDANSAALASSGETSFDLASKNGHVAVMELLSREKTKSRRLFSLW